MLQIKDKGLTLTIDNTTGLCFLKYMYPICKKHEYLYVELAKTLGTFIVTGRKGQLFMQFQTTGNSEHCFGAYKVVQKKLMVMSRTYKMVSLSQEIGSLQQ